MYRFCWIDHWPKTKNQNCCKYTALTFKIVAVWSLHQGKVLVIGECQSLSELEHAFLRRESAKLIVTEHFMEDNVSSGKKFMEYQIITARGTPGHENVFSPLRMRLVFFVEPSLRTFALCPGLLSQCLDIWTKGMRRTSRPRVFTKWGSPREKFALRNGWLRKDETDMMGRGRTCSRPQVFETPEDQKLYLALRQSSPIEPLTLLRNCS